MLKLDKRISLPREGEYNRGCYGCDITWPKVGRFLIETKVIILGKNQNGSIAGAKPTWGIELKLTRHLLVINIRSEDTTGGLG